MAQIARVCLIGPHSTGKSTLARELAAHYRTHWVAEYARGYALCVQHELTADDVPRIAEGQIANEESANGAEMLILDTDLVSTVVYSRHYYGFCEPWIEQKARERRADLYLLMDVDTPFIDDPVRDSADARQELFARFRAVLEELGVKYVVINGDWAARKRAAIQAIS
ncbi:MAG TPA: ATP-binding protein [Thermoanaerobaculia bacterium]|nr:ATP-binding protein [Thermoanaerobaculia bacterium]